MISQNRAPRNSTSPPKREKLTALSMHQRKKPMGSDQRAGVSST